MERSTNQTVFVIGGGPSVRDINLELLRHHDTIAVNCAVFDIPDPTYFITRDYTFMKNLALPQSWSRSSDYRFRRINCIKYFVAAFAGSSLKKDPMGMIVDPRCHLTYRFPPNMKVFESMKNKGLGLEPQDFRAGGDSGYCGLQLAVMLGYNNIYLLGFDLKVNRATLLHHYHNYYHERPGFDRKLEKWYKEYYIEAIQQVRRLGRQLYSCAQDSRLNNLSSYTDVREVLDGQDHNDCPDNE